MKILAFFYFVISICYSSEYQKIGKYLLEYSIFKIDIYEVSYHRSVASEKIELNYKIDVKKEHSIEGWKVGLKNFINNPKHSQAVNWLIQNSINVKEGDILSIIKSKEKLDIYHNNSLIASTTDPEVRALAFEPWIGESPINSEIKKSLLGKN